MTLVLKERCIWFTNAEVASSWSKVLRQFLLVIEQEVIKFFVRQVIYF